MGDGEKQKQKQAEYTVAEGDRMSKIAHEHGYKDYHALYMAQPEAFRKKRPNPEILMPGDTIVLPEKVEEKHSAKDRKAHTYEEDTALPEVRVVLRVGDAPLAGKSFYVTPDPAVTGSTGATTGVVKSDGDGALKFHVEPGTKKVTLVCLDPAAPFTFVLRLGELRPIAEPGGVEQRLDNLGYRVPAAPPAAPSGSDAEKKAKEAHERLIAKAVARFQEDRKKTADGKVDGDLKKLLTKAHEPT